MLEDALAEARKIVQKEFSVLELMTLGSGAEGFVFTDRRTVYKYIPDFDGDERGLNLLETLAGRLDRSRTLPRLNEVRRVGNDLFLTYPFEEGNPYSGGHLDDLMTFLRECGEIGFVCRNVHPDNFIVTPKGLKFIDLGRDIVPFDNSEFVLMCRRAFLMWRFHFRSDLKVLMTRSLRTHDLPELVGFEHFQSAVEPRPMSEVLNRALANHVAQLGASAILDYGCGKGGLARELASNGLDVTAFDPEPSVAVRWDSEHSGVDFLGSQDLDNLITERAGFDAVVCSRVLCEIENGGEFDSVLANLRSLVSEQGKVLVAVCNPFYYSTERTEGHERRISSPRRYDSIFTYRERDPSSTRWRKEVHRPLGFYRSAFLRAGLAIESIIEVETSDTLNMTPASDYLIFRLKPVNHPPNVSLMIKTCYMEWRTIERQIRQLTRQLEGPTAFLEKVVVVDQHTGAFTRQYEDPNPKAHRDAMNKLLADGIVDRVIYAPQDSTIIGETTQKWFGSPANSPRSASGQPIFATLWGLDQCEGQYILQMDSDLLIGRRAPNHDYLSEMISVFESDPDALFVPLPVSSDSPSDYTSKGDRGDWRVEVRGCLLKKDRIEYLPPIRNEIADGILQETWHRAFDSFIQGSKYRSYRGGDPKTFFIHVPNERKYPPEDFLRVMDRVESGFTPRAQNGRVDLRGEWDDWSGPKRSEPYIFIIAGRNIPPGQFRRCLDSVTSQTIPEWGAVVIDDASSNGMDSYARLILSAHMDRVTLIRNDERMGLMPNMWKAITRFCDDPQSVILTLDADDALASPRVLERIKQEYENGADVTVGSMLRLDKEARYPVNFTDPRGNRGGNVWQHLRTFRKYLFDAIHPEDLKLDGDWIDLANDWAYMLPIVEMATNPVHIPEVLYIYDPAPRDTENYVAERERNISRIANRLPYPSRLP